MDPKWCGNRIAFASNRDGDFDIYTMNPDGSGLEPVTSSALGDFAPDWSPDCTRIVFHRGDPRTVKDIAEIPEDNGTDENIYAITANRTGETFLAATPCDEREPAYSPDGTKIVFSVRHGCTGGYAATDTLYTMNADGSDQKSLGCGHCLSNTPLLPDWQPLRGPAPGSIAGKVTDQATKKGLGGATVDCQSGGRATTAWDGSYSLANVPPATYTCTASKLGYVSKSQSVTVQSGKMTTVNFALRKG